MAKRGKGDGGITVIKRIEEGGHGHHGGAWKVAYADFVTAMMAFFLLMWLLNATTEEQRRGIADFFNPTNALASAASGSGQPFGGMTPHSAGNMTSDTGAIRLERGPRPTEQELEEDESDRPAEPTRRTPGPPGDEDSRASRVDSVSDPRPDSTHEAAAEPPAPAPPPMTSEAARRLEAARAEQERFEEMADALRQTFLADPALAELARQVLVEITPEGLRVQLLEADGQPMFATGGAAPTERARQMIQRVAQAAARLPNPVQVTGHTDSTPFRGGGTRSNWDLSTERANATRRMLSEAGVAESRIRGVTGMADRDPLLPQQPQAAGNRRVAITLLRQAEHPNQGAGR
ncbi:flagellar motor protein MotB [Sediminicoccus rosea]|uniref:Flagellar motor protein MotB n=1 Tax=Sediminicoccus rosea TaxID=1225128 RepID=A0ABZ0PLH0_9PROT|nr:flagellar motor protein MotB [Sediminicoccus rosea]WPB86317.1 flagellar motor protein MotB [Sediminicoccus rosea]